MKKLQNDDVTGIGTDDKAVQQEASDIHQTTNHGT